MIKPIKTVTAYETADGQTFQTFAQARDWQACLKFADYYHHGNELWSGHLSTVAGIKSDATAVEPEALREWLLDNRTAVLELLTVAGGNDAAQL